MNQIVFSGMTDGIVMNRIIRDCEFNMPIQHLHSEYEIYYLLEGSRYYFIENETYVARKGSLVFVNKFQIHKTGQLENSYHDRILIEISDEPLTSLLLSAWGISLQDFFKTHSGVLDLTESGQKYIESLLFAVIHEIEKKSYKYEMMVSFKLAELFIYILRCKTEKNKLLKGVTADTAKYKKVHEIADYIVSNYDKVNSLDDLSKQFYVSKCYLSRIFKQITGFTVHEYINIHRIKRAQELLAEDDYNISEIAEALGYESITYFDRVFKKFAETSPLKYRKKLQLINQKARELRYEKGLSLNKGRD